MDLVKNTYRTLLTRGLKGCYLYFVDRNTERFVRSRTEALGSLPLTTATTNEHGPEPTATADHHTSSSSDSLSLTPFRRLRPVEVQPYVNCVPLVDLKFAAGTFTATQAIDPMKLSG